MSQDPYPRSLDNPLATSTPLSTTRRRPKLNRQFSASVDAILQPSCVASLKATSPNPPKISISAENSRTNLCDKTENAEKQTNFATPRYGQKLNRQLSSSVDAIHEPNATSFSLKDGNLNPPKTRHCKSAETSRTNLCDIIENADKPTNFTIPRHRPKLNGQLSCSVDAIIEPNKEKPTHFRLARLKQEFSGVYGRIKSKGKHLHHRMSLLSLSSSQESLYEVCNGRSIRVEFIDESSQRYRHSTGSGEDLYREEFDDIFDHPNHNYSAELMLTDLRDGCFSAELPLDALPTGLLTIRIRGFKMEIVVTRRGSSLMDEDHCVRRPMRYGDISIPIYVDPESLQFEVDEDSDVLHISGLTKGYNGLSLMQNAKRTKSDPSLKLKGNGDSKNRKLKDFGALTKSATLPARMPKSLDDDAMVEDRSISRRRTLNVVHP